MFEDSVDEWVAGDVEYTTALGRENDLKDEERKKPAVIQVCVHDLSLVYHICHADVECQDLKDFLESNRRYFSLTKNSLFKRLKFQAPLTKEGLN